MLDSNDLPKDFFGDDFFKLAGDILQHIMMEQIEWWKFTICRYRR